jgi:hypothetical protein
MSESTIEPNIRRLLSVHDRRDEPEPASKDTNSTDRSTGLYDKSLLLVTAKKHRNRVRSACLLTVSEGSCHSISNETVDQSEDTEV